MSQKTLEYLIDQGLVRTVPGNSDYIIVNSFTNPLSNGYTASQTSEYAIKISDFFAAVAADTSAEEVLYDPTVTSLLTATNLQDAIDELASDVNEIKPYKTYVVSLEQVATNAPTAIIMENTLDVTPILARTSTGIFTITATGQFIVGKTWHNISMPAASQNDEYFVRFEKIDQNVCQLNITNAAGSPVDEFIADLEIRVYN